jgi:S-(hydroxymethyl)glutathione dehydrogenase/alcohol dehydrogenase
MFIMKSEAVVLVETGKPLEQMELEFPPLQPGQILVDVATSGVCRSQINEARGLKGEDRYLPHTLGHEGAGTVLETGPEVTKVKIGDRVVLSWIKGGGAEVPSTIYRCGGRSINSGAISTFMRTTITCENRVTPIPESMPFREAALLGCALPTGAGAVLNTAGARPGNSVAVFGAGGVGLSAIAGARIAKAFPIVAIDIFDHKLQLAEHLGATHTINAENEDILEALKALTDGQGIDCAIECAGRIRTMEIAIEAIHTAGIVVLVGNLPAGQKISLDPFDLIRGKRIVGTWGGGTDPDRDIPKYAEMHETGELPLKELITHIYSLEDINQTLDDLESGKVGRAIIDNRREP